MLMRQLKPKPKFILKKLPMWGWQAPADKIDFEWPTQALFDSMLPDVSLKSIELKGFGNVIAGVKCTLSNGQASPMFERTE